MVDTGFRKKIVRCWLLVIIEFRVLSAGARCWGTHHAISPFGDPPDRLDLTTNCSQLARSSYSLSLEVSLVPLLPRYLLLITSIISGLLVMSGKTTRKKFTNHTGARNNHTGRRLGRIYRERYGTCTITTNKRGPSSQARKWSVRGQGEDC